MTAAQPLDTPPSRRRLTGRLRIGLHCCTAVLVVCSLTGCLKEILFLGLAIHGPPSIEPDFDAQTGKSMTDRGVSVAVLCEAPLELRNDFGKIDLELGKYLTLRLVEHQIRTRHFELVQAWLDEHYDWDTPTDLGAALGVTYVIHLEIEKYSLFVKNNSNLMQGRTEGLITVYEMADDGTGRSIYSSNFRIKHPRYAPRSTQETPPATFKHEFLSRLSDLVGWYFYEHMAGDDIPDAT